MNIARTWGIGGALVITLAGCGASGDALRVGAEPATGGSTGGGAVSSGGGGATGGTSTGDQAASPGLDVFVTADRTSLCPGECVEVSAVASGGQPEYFYEWTADLGDGPGPHRVCPETTATYQVTITDSGTGEFAAASAVQGKLTIEVLEDCAVDDGGLKPGTEVGSTEIICENEWTAENLSPMRNTLRVNEDGHTVFVGNHFGRAQLDDFELASDDSQQHSFVAEVDENCRVIWAKSMGDAASRVEVISAVRDEDGSIYVTGMFSGVTDFGNGPIGQVWGALSTGFLLKLSPDRSLQWVLPFGSAAPPLVIAPQYNLGHSLALDAEGNIAFGFTAGPSTVLGGDVTIDTPNARGAEDFVAKLTSTGEVLWQRPLGPDWSMDMAVESDGSVVVTGLASGSTVDTGQGPVALTGGHYLARFSPSGEPSAVLALPTPKAIADLGISGVSVLALDQNDRAVVTSSDAEPSTGSGGPTTLKDHVVMTLDRTGEVQRVLPLGELSDRQATRPLIAIDRSDHLVSAVAFDDMGTVAGRGVGTAGERTLAVAKWEGARATWLHEVPLDSERLVSMDSHATHGVAMLLHGVREAQTGSSTSLWLKFIRLAP